MTDDTELLAVIRDGPTGQVRACLSEFKGRAYFDLRLWYVSNSGEYAPTRKGVTLPTNCLPSLAAAVAEAVERFGFDEGE